MHEDRLFPGFTLETLEDRRLLTAQAPYLGSPFAVGSSPVTIGAEHYDVGGEGISYSDRTATNMGSGYRAGANEGVDLKLFNTGQYRVSDAYPGEWIEYSLNVQQSGNYTLDLRLSNTDPNAKVHVEVDGVNVSGSVTVPDTGSFNTFATASRRISLSAGARVLRLSFDAGYASTSAVAGVDWMRLTRVEDSASQEPAPQPSTISKSTGAYVRGGASAGTNFGSASTLVVKKYSTAAETRETYLKFDLTGVTSIAGAKLRLWSRLSGTTTSSVKVNAQSASNTGWGESTLIWNSKPATGSTIHGSVTVTGSTSKWYEIDVTSFLRNELAAGRKVVTLVLKGAANANAPVLIDSDETSNRPRLAITPDQVSTTQSLIVSHSAMTVNEGTRSAFSVKLAAAPASNVSVTLSRETGSDPDLKLDAGTLVFTPASWNVAQSVAVSAGADPDTADGRATFAITSSGLSSKTLVATENDDDTTRQPGRYYVSPSGNDANAGTATDHAWQTIGKINSMVLLPGDTILFESGKRFGGNLYFDEQDSGTADDGTLIAPITIGSYGTAGRATITAGESFGVFAWRNGGFVIENLNFVGLGRTANGQDGLSFYNDTPGVQQRHINLRNVSVSGFGKNGLALGGSGGYRGVDITDSKFFANRDGVNVYGPAFNAASPTYVNRDVRVARVRAYDNPGQGGVMHPTGNGIVLASVRDGLIERSVAYNNGANNSSTTGPVGIWAYDADRVVIQHNESYGNRRGTGGDGDGFDFDQNTSNSVMQYNYAHDNEGAGYLLWTGKGNTAHSGNVVRYNVSENDGRTVGYGGIVVGGNVYDLDVYNNTVFFSPLSTSGSSSAAMNVIDIGDDVAIRNNVFITTGGAQLLRVGQSESGLRLQRNAYWSSGDASAFRWNGTTYSSVSGWLNAASTQERVDLDGDGRADIAALSVNPRLTSPGNGGTVGDANDLNTLAAYKLLSDSPLREAGLDLAARYGIDPGDRDFFGTMIEQDAEYDLGTDEF